MTGSACTWDADGVEVSPIQQRAVMRELRRALVDPELDGVVLGRALHGDQWKEGFDSAVECVDARIEHLTGHIEGLADPVPPAPPSRRGLDALDVWDGSVAPGGWVCDVCRCPVESEPCREHQPKAYAEMRAEAPATPGDDRGRELAGRIVKAIGDPGAVIGNRDWGSDERLIDWQTRAVLSVLPPLAAPAETVEKLTRRLTQACAVLEGIDGVLAERGHRRGAPGDHVNAVRAALAVPAETEATYAIEGRDETCPSCHATVGTSLAYVLDEHTSSIEDGPGSENPPTLCGGSEVAVHHVLAASPPAQGPAETEAGRCTSCDHHRQDHDFATDSHCGFQPTDSSIPQGVCPCARYIAPYPQVETADGES